MMRSPCPSCLLIGWLVCWTGSVRSGRLSLLSSLSICSSIHSSSDSSPAESRVLRLTLTSRLRRRAWNTLTLVKQQHRQTISVTTEYSKAECVTSAPDLDLVRIQKNSVDRLRLTAWPLTQWMRHFTTFMSRLREKHKVNTKTTTLKCFYNWKNVQNGIGDFWKNCAVCITDNIH